MFCKFRSQGSHWTFHVVIAGEATTIGDYINHNPIINIITANPARINPGESTDITVSASDVDGDALSYSYSASVGTVTGSGSTAFYTSPSIPDNYRIDVVVSDGKGGFSQGSIFVSDTYRNGNLVVNSREVDGEPLDSYIYVYKQSTGASVDSGSTGNDGTITFSLLEDIYKIRAVESNDIWVENILVVYGNTGIIIGNDTNNTAPVINSYYPIQTHISINEGENILFRVNASDPDGTNPQYRWALNGIFQSALPTWTFFTSHIGSVYRNITVEVTDGQYSVYQTWHVDVTTNTTTPTPIATPISTSTVTPTPNPTSTPTPTGPGYDANGNGIIEKNEAVQAVVDYFGGLITKQEAINVVLAYFGG